MSRAFRFVRCIIPITVCFASLPSFAEESPEAVTEPPAAQSSESTNTKVEEPITSPEAISAPTEPTKAVVTATRFEATIDTAPTNVTVVTAEEIRASNARTIPEALQQLGGVRVQSGAGTRVDLAGFGETGALNSLILINGRRLNDVDLSGANLSMIALQSVARIEIIRGAATVLYGDNAAGGVINIVTTNGFEGPAFSALVRAGSFSTLEIGGQGRWSNDRFAVIADANHQQSDGYRDHNVTKASRAGSEFTALSGDTTWGIRGQVFRDDNELPGAIDEAQYRADPTKAGTYLMDTEESHSALDLFYNSPGLAGEFSWRKKDQKSSSNFDDSTDANLTTLSATPRYRVEDESNTRILGADIYRSSLDTKSESPGFGTNVQSDVTRNSIALYASDNFSLGSVVALGFGLRAQNVSTDVKSKDLATSTNTSDDRNELEYGWDLSLQFRYPGGARSHVRVARSFRFAVLDEMWSYFDGTVTMLDPQVGKHVEVGGQFPFSKDTQFDVTLYRITLTDEIGYDPAAFANTNLDPTERQGADLAFRIKPVDMWSLRLTHSYRVAKFRSGPMKGKQVPDVPKNTYTVGNSLDAGIAGLFTLDAQFVGKRYFGSDYANTGKQMSSYSLINAGWGYNFPHGNVQVGVNNVADKKVADSGYYFDPDYYYYPLPGRSYSVTLRLEL